MNGEDVLIPLGFFAMVVSIVYLALRQKERMSLIARGSILMTCRAVVKVPYNSKPGFF